MRSEEIENRIYASRLFSKYGVLLTENQKNVISAYFLADLSLSEIATEEGISRAGVSLTLKAGLEKMKEFEESLHLLEKDEAFLNRLKEIDSIQGQKEKEMARAKLLEELKNGI